MLRVEFNTNWSNIVQFSQKAKYFVLRHQFSILLENYEDAFANVVKFGNQHCTIRFEPETSHFGDIPDPMLKIYNSQQTSGFLHGKASSTTVAKFVSLVTKSSSMMPFGVRQLDVTKLGQLKALCKSLHEITAIFTSVNRINHTYADKDGYVIKRLYQLTQDENAFREEGFSQESRVYTPTYEGKVWQLGQFPTDVEIVSSVFCALLDYSVGGKRKHLYDATLPRSEIYSFHAKDISLVNRQPSSIFRAHFEVLIGQKVFYSLPGELNIWLAFVWVFAAI